MKRPEFTDMMEAARVSSFIEEGSYGRWKLKHFEVTPKEEAYSRALAVAESDSQELIQMRLARTVPAGRYICLQRRATPMERADIASEAIADAYAPDGPEWVPIMSDTPSEIQEHAHALENAHGRVLITGLGLGVLVSALLTVPEVEHITVVEIDRDVIALTGPYYADHPKVEIVNMDAAAFPAWRQKFAPYARFDYAWHDIWSNIAERNIDDDDLAEHGISYHTLFDAYAPFCDDQSAWAYTEALMQREVNDLKRLRLHEWRRTMLFGTDEERVEGLITAMIRDQAAQMLPADGTIPDHVREFFESQQGIRGWAENVVRNDGLKLDKIRRDYEEGTTVLDPMDRPNEAPEANVA